MRQAGRAPADRPRARRQATQPTDNRQLPTWVQGSICDVVVSHIRRKLVAADGAPRPAWRTACVGHRAECEHQPHAWIRSTPPQCWFPGRAVVPALSVQRNGAVRPAGPRAHRAGLQTCPACGQAGRGLAAGRSDSRAQLAGDPDGRAYGSSRHVASVGGVVERLRRGQGRTGERCRGPAFIECGAAHARLPCLLWPKRHQQSAAPEAALALASCDKTSPLATSTRAAVMQMGLRRQRERSQVSTKRRCGNVRWRRQGAM